MAATDSPRRILGDCDVNKALFVSQSPTTISPGKRSCNSVMREKSLNMGYLGHVLLSPKMELVAAASINTPRGGKKRSAACLEDVQERPQRKQPTFSRERGDCEVTGSMTGGFVPRTLQGGELQCRLDGVIDGANSSQGTPGRSMSPDSSFDTTQDSDNIDSQNTTLTEPEDHAAFPMVTLTVAQPLTPWTVTQEEVRENAEALRLRLQVAMYKVNTNQTDLPLSQLQIRSSKLASRFCTTQLTRKPLPSSRPQPENPTCPMPQQIGIKSEETTAHVPSPQPKPIVNAHHETSLPQSSITTPLPPRSRDGFSHPGTQQNPEASLT